MTSGVIASTVLPPVAGAVQKWQVIVWKNASRNGTDEHKMSKLTYDEWRIRNPFTWCKELEKDIVDKHDITIESYVENLQRRAYERYMNEQ